MERVIFIFTLLLTLGVFTYTAIRYYRVFRKFKPYKVDRIGQRIKRTLEVVFAQTRILKRPIGILHALLFWGFIIILFSSLEMVVDGVLGTERIFGHWKGFYTIISGGGDIFAPIIAVFVIIFILRRTIIPVKRFEGREMKHKNHVDALIALTLILILMITFMGINTFYIIYKSRLGEPLVGVYPFSHYFASLFPGVSAEKAHLIYRINWWIHIITIFIFANILPYSKHFHVYLSAPNVFLSRLEPMGKMDTMEEIKGEILAMLNPEVAADTGEEPEIERFGALDVTDFSWKIYLDSLSCTQCGRCTSVCPANITGKLLSPRKLEMNFRERTAEITPQLLKGEEPDQEKTLLYGYITEEELWACTSCHACVNECPIMIHHTSIIFELRRYLVMEKSSAPAGLITAFQNIENNGAPWQFSQEDRMLWAENITVNGEKIHVPTMAEMQEKGQEPEYLFWVGSAGAFDERYRKVVQNFVKILHHLGISYAVLGTEEIDTGDVARRAGNEMLYQMQTFQIIEMFKQYNVKKIVTCDPHDYNTFKNEYPDFGGDFFQVWHHTEFLEMLIREGRLKLNGDVLGGKRITFHDPCYLGRINRQIEAPRFVLKQLNVDLVEMPRHGYNSFCCGAGGGQMFKEAEPGKKEVFIERTEEALGVDPEIIVTACPFCMTMLTDGLKYKNVNDKISDYDIAELVAMDLGLA